RAFRALAGHHPRRHVLHGCAGARMRHWLLFLLLAFALAAPAARAERVVANLSTDLIEITSSYDGERITFFGAIEPQAGDEQAATGPYHVVIVVTGPSQDRLARQKTRRFGIWLNTDE